MVFFIDEIFRYNQYLRWLHVYVDYFVYQNYTTRSSILAGREKKFFLDLDVICWT